MLWESDSQKFALIDSKYLFNTLNSQTTPYSFTVTPASSNQTLSFLANIENMYVAVVNIPEVHQIYSRDMYGNPKIDQSDVYQVTLTNVASPAVVVNAVMSSPANSVYQMSYTLKVAGTYTIKILL